jgi:hypothetical protein
MDIPKGSMKNRLVKGEAHAGALFDALATDDEEMLTFKPRPQKHLRHSALAPASLKVSDPTAGEALRRSELVPGSPVGRSITTMENANVEAIICAMLALRLGSNRAAASLRRNRSGCPATRRWPR